MPSLKKRDPRAQQQPSTSAMGSLRRKNADHIVPPAEGDSGTGSANWRELAHRIQQETDSGVMLELVQQLITKLDEEKSRNPRGK